VTSLKKIEANRRNAAKSTGPVTEEGKERSRRNAVRHGLTAETVIGVEDAEDYKAFEAAIIADYDAQSAIERELVLRLASALWRLRRATAMETGLFQIEADHLSASGQPARLQPPAREVVYALFRSGHSENGGAATGTLPTAITPAMASRLQADEEEPAADPGRHLAQCYLRLANLPSYPLDRLSRYEYALWRQVAQILFALDAFNRRKPQERRPLMRAGAGHTPYEQDRCFDDT
jgi:hypothetical protein